MKGGNLHMLLQSVIINNMLGYLNPRWFQRFAVVLLYGGVSVFLRDEPETTPRDGLRKFTG